MERQRHLLSAGITLMELMTVIAVIGILSAISIPPFIQWQQSARLNSAAWDLKSDLSFARSHAIKTGEAVTVRFVADGYTLFIDADDNGTVSTGDRVLRNKDYPGTVAMGASTFEDNQTVFGRTGEVSPARTSHVLLSRGNANEIRIEVNTVGRIKVETL